jgi:DNA helicase-2/ATP-dependent DNA helicase PcrA
MELGPELSMLMDLSLDQIGEAGGPVLKEAILRMREDRVIREEGYDGEYGNIRLFNETEMKSIAGQMALFAVETPKTPKKATPDVKLKRKPRAVSPTPAQQSLSVTDPILDPLNDEQKMAVLHEADNLLVVAGPGTGKTMTLTHRIAYVIRSNLAQANQVLALTFTRKAAQEMQERIHKLLEIPDKEEIRVSTFHGLCLDILRNNGDRIGLSLGFDLCTEMDAVTLMRRVVTESGIDRRSIQRHVDNISRMRKSVVSKTSGSSDHPDTLTLLNEYRRRLREMGMQDLDGLEEEALGLLQDHPDIAESISKAYPRLFVDEYQDTNGIQVEILKRLYRPGKTHVFAIGDPDQSIYGFRGADVNNFHSFAEDFPDASEVTLLRNYRSTPFILEGAAAVMEKAEPLQSQQKDAAPIAIAPCNTEKEEAEMIVEQVERMIGGTTYFSLDSGRVDSHEGELSLGFGDMGVLFRLNAQGDAIEEAFGRAGIPFVRSGEKPLIRTYPVDVIWRFLQTVQRPDNPFYREAFEKLLKDYGLAKRDGDSIATEKVSVLKILDQAITLHHITCDTDEAADALRRLRHLAENFKENIEGLLDTLSLERGIDHALLLGDRVALMSLHAAKGLEWPVVFITGCEDRLLPCTLFGDKNDAEERRLFYVGMTRARFSLVLSYTGRRSLNGRMWEMGPSPFLAQIPEGISAPLDRRGWKSRKRPHKQLDFFSA